MAKDLRALVVFAEHRYEGESIPTLVGLRDCLAFCTSSQALADFAVLIDTLRKEYTPPGSFLPAVAL